MDNILQVKINKKLEDFILDVDFETKKGILGLLGASGSGKSMILKCIAGIEKADAGMIKLNDNILFDSENKVNLSPQKRHIAYLFQNYALFPQMTIWENVFYSVNKKYSKEEKEDKTEKILSLLHLKKKEKCLPSSLSGGEQQRVAIARIIVNEPDFLLLDEPFSALDTYLKCGLIKELKEILLSFEKGIIFVSHDILEVKYLCDEVIILSNGKQIERNSIKNILESPKEEITKKLIFYSSEKIYS